MKKHTKCRMNEICRRPHRDGECERNCYYNTLEVKTNADKIRAMSDEELADQFTKNGVFLCPAHNPNCLEADCRQCFLDWLKQEATDGNSR